MKLKDFYDVYTGNYVIPFEDYKKDGLCAVATFFVMAHQDTCVKEFDHDLKVVMLIEKSNL